MPQTCPACLWISSDEAEACERCGEPFGGRREPELPVGAIGNGLKIFAALFAAGVLAAIGVQRLGGRFPGVREGIKGWAQAFYTWLLGPDEVFKPYLIAALVVSTLVWLVLWLLARLSR